MSDPAVAKATFSDGKSEDYPKGTSFAQIIEKKGGLPRSIIAVKVNGNLIRLNCPPFGRCSNRIR